jgi:hypothetical protein
VNKHENKFNTKKCKQKKENGTGLKTDRLYKRIRAQPEYFFSGDRLSKVMLGSYLFYTSGSSPSFTYLSPIFHLSFTFTFCPLLSAFSPSFTLTFHSFICALFINKELFLHNRRGRERKRERKGSEEKEKGKENGSGRYKSAHTHNSSMKPP